MRPAVSVLLVLPWLLFGQLPQFTDVTVQSKVRFRTETSSTSQKYLIETMGGGVALFDYDGDSYDDLFFVNGAALTDPMPTGRQPDKSNPRFWNRLFRNNGDGTFADVTEKAGLQGHGYGMGVAVGDYDNDGYPDVYVTGVGSNMLYRNNGNGTFTDVTARAGVAALGWSTSAAFLDYDRDGYLDLVVARYLDWDFSMNIWCGDRSVQARAFCHPDIFKPLDQILYRNNGNGTFKNVSSSAGFSGHPGNGLGVAVDDFDRDGWPDIAIANDALPQQLFRNTGRGTFAEQGTPGGIAYDDNGQTFSGMGIDFNDFDNDGWPDLLITDLAMQNWAYFRNEQGQLRYDSSKSGIAKISYLHSGWGVGSADFDNDGWKDLFVAQSHVMDDIEKHQPGVRYLEPPAMLRNVKGRFEDASAGRGAPFDVAVASRGVGVGDLDNDGFDDVVFTVLDGDARVLRNSGNRNHWISIDTVGTRSNRDGIGTRIHIVSASGQEQWAMVTRSGGYLSARDKRVHFGLGGDRTVKQIELTWPSGVIQRLSNVVADHLITVREPEKASAR